MCEVCGGWCFDDEESEENLKEVTHENRLE